MPYIIYDPQELDCTSDFRKSLIAVTENYSDMISVLKKKYPDMTEKEIDDELFHYGTIFDFEYKDFSY